MIIITREQAKDLRNAFQCWQQDYDPVEDKEQHDMFGLAMVAMDALLASLEAEPVMNEIVIPEPATHRNINEICPPGVNQTLFASGWNASRKSGMNSGRIPPIVKGIDAECMGWNACRDAMLRGAEHVSNRDELPEGWVACSERMPNIGVPVITCCGDVVQYAAYAWDGKEWQDWYEEYDKLPANTFTHWHSRPAAPQQEVK
ncbi:TPA: DUF551 domain-containing protein [Enterobacter cloacae]|uniref:DUF551 domain-containing protein n=1 Tax=Enterobacter cloacae TaxID=550 RepID=UPI00211BDF40|nr:DUF551 domain-containing protein [Enterobacter cloacae]MCQ9484364.1 DUF551 domain-containing protein [Enterobacter cloacae]MCQ9527468.1 DUF551 domain-containing protein [Enterobacter cloacae]MCQ9570057.1 DUF551 domain-containing protein [Enterobacter cloacae]HCD7173164.1 DUF551 domain-containing protein [Enterobacter cloacae]HDC4657830.1 DUF551 domain-containing protein [Enterobacter cloacae]